LGSVFDLDELCELVEVGVGLLFVAAIAVPAPALRAIPIAPTAIIRLALIIGISITSFRVAAIRAASRETPVKAG
jgi:hypothetical protein